MPLLTSSPSSSGSNNSVTWTNLANAYDASTTTGATYTGTNNGPISISWDLSLNGFNFSSIPNGAIINSFSATVHHNVSSPANRFNSIVLYSYANGNKANDLGSVSLSLNTGGTFSETVSWTPPAGTRGSSINSGFEVLYSAFYSNTVSTNGTSTFRYITLTVNYSTESWGSLYL